MLGWEKHVKLRNSEKVVKWVASGRGGSRLVQNDQRNCRNVFKQVLANNSLEKQRKTWKYLIFHRRAGDIIRLRIKPYGEGIPKYNLFMICWF